MGKKKVKTMLSAAAVMTAAGSGIFCAWKAGRKKKMAEVRTDAPDLEEGLTEEKVGESLLRLFRLYEDSEFDDLAEFLGDGSDPREYAAENYSEQLFLYLKRNMTDAMVLEGDDGTGKEPFAMTDELFHYPACMINCRIEELLSDNFTLCLENEIWMLENGEFASVYCVSLTNGIGRLSYRFLDTYIKNPWDIPVSFDDLESSFASRLSVKIHSYPIHSIQKSKGAIDAWQRPKPKKSRALRKKSDSLKTGAGAQGQNETPMPPHGAF